MKLFKRRGRTQLPETAQEDLEAGEDAQGDHVAGERGAPSILRASTIQSRVSNVMAIGLMAILGIGVLTWYYSRALSEPGKAAAEAKKSARAQVQGDMTLPPLGPIDPPTPAERELSPAEKWLGPAPDAPPPDDVPDAWLKPAKEAPPAAYPAYAPQTKSPEQLALERKLSGPVVANASANNAPAATASEVEMDADDTAAAEQSAPASGPMAAMLKPSVTPAARARVLPTQRLMLAKGAFLDCTLETAMDSTLPGMTTCVTATDTFGVDGKIVLLERGTKLIGETRGQVQQGSARIFVLWTEARTPTGVVIPLASPGTDELGRSGLGGQVNRHFWDRFGAAILISVIDGAIQREVQSHGKGTGAVVYDPNTSESVITEVIKSTVNIPPTVTKNNGDRIQVLVARDLDFRTVYELRATPHAR